MLPRSYPNHFYVFEDATSPQILLSYATSEELEILELKVPKLVTHLHIDALTIPISPSPGGSRKATKSITFCDPLIDLDQPHHTFPHSGLRKTNKTVHFSDPVRSTINGTKGKHPSLSQQLPLPGYTEGPLFKPLTASWYPFPPSRDKESPMDSNASAEESTSMTDSNLNSPEAKSPTVPMATTDSPHHPEV